LYTDLHPTHISPLPLHDALPISYTPMAASVLRLDLIEAAVSRLPPPKSVKLRETMLYLALLAMTHLSAATTPPVLVSRSAISLRSEEHTSELQSQSNLVCRLLLE